jgi:hypothetical protein
MLIRGTSRWHPEQTTTEESDLVLAPRLSDEFTGLTFGSTGFTFEEVFLPSFACSTFLVSTSISAPGDNLID